MITATHQSLIAETIKGMTELELESLLEEIAPHFKKERLIPILKRAFDFQGYEADIYDLEGEVEELRDDNYELRELVEEIGMLACSAKGTDNAETLYNYLAEIQAKCI